jgi:hypothetical protein
VISIFAFVYPGLLKRDDQRYVKDHIRPYILRRRTEEVLPDLPACIDEETEIELSSEQRRAYDSAERNGVVELNQKGDSITIQHVFQLITSLRQICNFDPATGASAKLERLVEDLEEIDASGRKALVFSQFKGDSGLSRLGGSLRQYSPLSLHGDIPAAHRDAFVNQFAADPRVRVFLLQYRVGGVGLNLQSANYVYLFDRWWNPAVEDQAVKLAHRLGQTSKVFVKRFFCRDTIEERIIKKLLEKRRLFDAVIDEDRPDRATGLTEEEIMGLFPGLTVRPKRRQQPGDVPRVVLHNLDPRQFEVLVAEIYEKQGYSVTLTGGSHDAGIDILARKRTGIGEDKVVVQCKHQTATVGRPEVQKLWGVVHADATITRGDFVTSARFSREAREFAADKRLTLIDRSDLIQLASQFSVAQILESPIS